jgi:hypothetical protein
MRWLGVEPTLIAELSAGDWEAFADRSLGGPPVDSAMERLMRFVAPHLPERAGVQETRSSAE